MSHRPWRDIVRRKSRQIMVGNVPIGGDAPIAVQTMTNTPTEDAAATIEQIRRCEDVGADLIRVSCPTVDATAAMPAIVRASKIPIIADIHFHYKRALEAADAGAACLRINPGNIGSPERVKEVVRAAKANGCAIRIGVNAGSLERHLLEKYGEPCPEALVESAFEHAKMLEDADFHEFKVAVKASDVFLAVAAYHGLAETVDCPLHLGITEAGGLIGGTVKSSIGMGSLLWFGIGDTSKIWLLFLAAFPPITMATMATATALIGMLPTAAQVGLWVIIPLYILKMIQGFSTGGEYGGAATFMAEYAPDKRRGFMGSWLEFGTLAGGPNYLEHQLYRWPEAAKRTFDPIHSFSLEIGHFIDRIGELDAMRRSGRRVTVIDADAAIYHVVKQIIIASLHGHPQPLVIEAARSVIQHKNQPGFAEV